MINSQLSETHDLHTGLVWRSRITFHSQPPDILHIINDVTGQHFKLKHISPAHIYLCELLRQNFTATDLTRELHNKFPDLTLEQQNKFLSQLASKGLLQNDRPLSDQTRYARQISYFSYFERPDHNSEQMQIALQKARVTILGLGGVGNWIAWQLAAVGVGHLTLVDNDCVELSNLNRQALYNQADIGQLKVTAAQRALIHFNPELSVETIDMRITSTKDIENVVTNADIFVLTADKPMIEIRCWASQASLNTKRPYIQGSLDAYLLQVGPLYIPYQTGCYTCRETAMRNADPENYDLRIQAFINSPRQCPPLFGPFCGFVSTAVAMDTIRFLTKHATPTTLGRYLLFNATNWQVSTIEINRVSNCPMCGAQL